MYKLIIYLSLSLISLSSLVPNSIAQQSFEQEAIEFGGQYQKAMNEKNIAFLEKHIDDQFVSIGPNSNIQGKAQSLEYARKPVAKQDFKIIETKAIPVKTVSSGNLVVITTNWKVVRQANSVQNAEPQTDSGTTTAVFQKTDVWRIVSEHVAFDRPSPNSSLTEIYKTSGVFDRALVLRNYDDAERLMAPGYIRVDDSGKSSDRVSFLSDLRTAKLMILSVRTNSVYINQRENTAIETGMVEIKTRGISDQTDSVKTAEYTRIWKKSDDWWKISADYFRRPQ